MTRAAALLFHRNPDRWFPKAYVRLARFRGAAELLYQDELRGSLLMQAERAVDLIFTKYLQADIAYKGVQRIETFPYPQEAIREALYNPLIATAFYESGFVERWGRGMSIIFDACQRHGIPAPKYVWNEGMVKGTFEARPDFSALNDEGKGTLLLRMIEATPRASLAKLSERSGLSLSELRRIIRLLQENGRLSREGGKRGGFWKVSV